MSDCEILEKLGLIIEEYFDEERDHDKEFNLLVDEYLFDYFLERLKDKYGIPKEQLFNALREVKCDFHGNPYVALTIAAYQVSIFYELDPNTSYDDYNKRLFSSRAFKGLKLNPYKDYWWQGFDSRPEKGDTFQDNLWSVLKMEFKIKNVPEPKYVGDRYVQYPKSQNTLGSSIKIFRSFFATRFLNLQIEPNQGLTYDVFEKLVFDGISRNYNELARRLAFLFYNKWNGKPLNGTGHGTQISREYWERKEKDECFIQIDPKPVVRIKGLKIDLNKEKIPDRYLWHFSETSGTTSKGLCFIEDEEGYGDWLPTHRCIDPDEPVLILTDATKLPAHIRDAVGRGEVREIPAGRYKILVLEFKSQRGFVRFGISLKQKPVFKLTGGLKVNGNTYYDFALPAVQLTEGQDKAKYKHVFIDSKKYTLADGFFKIPEADVFSEGEHFVKLTDSWNSSKICFKIQRAKKADILAEHGWKLDYEGKIYTPSCSVPETAIDGVRLLTRLNWIERKKSAVSCTITNSTDLRNFEEQQEHLLFRFEYIGNKAINQRGKYGN